MIQDSTENISTCNQSIPVEMVS